VNSVPDFTKLPLQMLLCTVLLFLRFDSRATSKTSTHSKHVHATVADQPGSQVITVGQSQTTARLLRQVRDDSLDPRHITRKSFVKFMVLSNDTRVQVAIGILCCTVGVYARRKATRQHHLSQGCIQQTRLACRLIHNLGNACASSAASRCVCNSERNSALSGTVLDALHLSELVLKTCRVNIHVMRKQ